MMLLIGLIAVLALGAFHYPALLLIKRVSPGPDGRPAIAVFVNFTGLVLLHSAEILAFAALYAVILHIDPTASMGGTFSGTWQDYVYFSGINFMTLGYTQIEAGNDLRLLAMMESLGGFMALTWSATFIYSVCRKSWSDL